MFFVNPFYKHPTLFFNKTVRCENNKKSSNRDHDVKVLSRPFSLECHWNFMVSDKDPRRTVPVLKAKIMSIWNPVTTEYCQNASRPLLPKQVMLPFINVRFKSYHSSASEYFLTNLFFLCNLCKINK